MKTGVRQPLSSYIAPRYWPTWLGVGLLRLTCWLPFDTQIRLGKWLGRVMHRFVAERRAITRRNIELCFPDLSPAERNSIALQHFESLGASLMEMALGRWASDEKLNSRITIIGAEHVHKLTASGQGVVILSAHFTALEIFGRPLGAALPEFDVVYRKFRNSLTTELVATTREMYARKVIEKNDIKSMVRSLREGIPVWYAPDQSYNLKQSALIDFFGIPSQTNIASGMLARLGRARAVYFFPRRLSDGNYELVISPPFADFPSDDPVADTKRYVEVLEQFIRTCPEQYYWVHRKFKNRPDYLDDAYADLDAVK